jgi:hypothetical protein
MVEDPKHARKDESIPRSLVRGAASGLRIAGSGLAQMALGWLRWLGAGAVGGAVVLGGVGLYFFGLNGLALGAGVGAVLGVLLVLVAAYLAATADIW